jgi:hypothetical protein
MVGASTLTRGSDRQYFYKAIVYILPFIYNAQ